MRGFAVAGLIAAFACSLPGQITPAPADVAVVFEFQGAHSAVTSEEMQFEAAVILAASGVRLTWVPRSEATGDFGELVVMTFKGSCDSEPSPPDHGESGPFAVTRTADGVVLPFAEVDCARVIRSVRAAMWGSDWSRSDRLVGRALGRVVVHELVHMLTKSADHSHDGIEKAALSGRQLIAPSLTLSAGDAERLREAVGNRGAQRSRGDGNLKDQSSESVTTTGR
jgi:hypothetical protein